MLTLGEAISIGLSENLGIEVARIEQQAAKMQVYRSNAGFGPQINLNANAGGTANRVVQNFLNGTVVDRFGRSLTPNISVDLDMVIFDGGRMEAVFDRLRELSQVSDIETQIAIQNLVSLVIQSYYEVMQLKARVTFLNTVIRYYEDRSNITEERWTVGRGSKIDFLQSKTDLNAQLSERTATMNDFENAKIRLNSSLNRRLDIDFDVQDEVVFNEEYSLVGLLQSANEKNQDLVMLRKFHDISLVFQKEIAAGRKPQVSFSSTLGFFYLNTNAGFLLSNQNASLNVGFNARWNIFNGKHLQNQIAIAQVNSHSLQKQEELLLTRIESDLTEAFNQYLSNKQLLDFEEENRKLAEENLAISLEKFRLGGSTILELNEAQRSYDTALNRLVDAQHIIRVSELRLLEISGQLIR